ncbi:MAG: hypothetical protein P8X74_03745 [Reinekea sp.]
MAREKIVYKEGYKKPYHKTSEGLLNNWITDCHEVAIVEQGIIERNGKEYSYKTFRVLNKLIGE